MPPGMIKGWLPSFGWLLNFNPVYLVIAPTAGPLPGAAPVTFRTQAVFFALGMAVSAMMVGVTVWRIRPVVIREMGNAEGSESRLGKRLRAWSARWWPGPTMDRDPVYWRECRRRKMSRWTVGVWGVYALFGGTATLAAIGQMMAGNIFGAELGTVVNAILVGIGLLLMSGSAATSLSEERQRGSLDVLLATPLPSWRIVWAKWRASFRSLPWLLVLPISSAVMMSSATGRIWAVWLLAALILAYGAALTSLGLGLATWVSRPGRAAAITAGMYVSMTLGWVPLSQMLMSNALGRNSEGLMGGSPLAGVGMLCTQIYQPGGTIEVTETVQWTVFWTVAYGAVASGLLLMTFETFNGFLGRMYERRDEGSDRSTE